MKKVRIWPVVAGLLAAAFVAFIGTFGLLIPLNFHARGFWLLIIVVFAVFLAVRRVALGFKDFGRVRYAKRTKKGRKIEVRKFNINFKPYILLFVFIAVFIVLNIAGSKAFNASRYASILTVQNADFSKDISESVGTDSFALMDTASAKMLGDREIGSLSSVVSQFNVSDDYTQIDYRGKPVKVSALGYAGFFKWINNRDSGVVGYVTVDPVSMSAHFTEYGSMKYVPSAYLLENASRHLWLKYPTLMLGDVHFEIDEDGKPYYIAPIYEKTVALLGGKTVSGCVVLDPVTGETQKYEAGDVPQWIDVVFDGDLICEQYNWYGKLQNGFLNSLIGKKGCKQVTTYDTGDEVDYENDSVPLSDYGYVSKDGDIWIYTGVTSLNGDSSNIGFLLANERTGEAHYFDVAGADEKSAMAAAEGEVQEKGYQASFPSLISVGSKPTYIMVLKDSGGLVKLYAAVNVEQYNIVTTATTQKECLEKYKTMLGMSESGASPEETEKITVKIESIRYIDIDGNTYIYLITADGRLFKAKASEHEEMLLLKEGDKAELECSGSFVTSFKRLEK